MTVKGVKLRHVDDRSPYGYPVRALDIETSHGVLSTPVRTVTNHEYTQKTRAPTDMLLDDSASMFVHRFSATSLDNFLSVDSAADRLSDKLRVYKERSQHSFLSMALIGTAVSKNKEKRSPVDVLDSEKVREKFYRLIISLQRLSGFDPVAIPIPGLSLSVAKETMRSAARTAEHDGYSCVFFLEPGRDFPSLLEYAVGDLDGALVGVKYKRYTKAVHSYEALRSYYDRDVAFIMTDIARHDPLADDMSTPHYLPFLSNDLYGLAVPMTGRGPARGMSPEKRLASIRVFDRDRLVAARIAEAKVDVDRILVESGRPGEPTLRDMLSNYGRAGEQDGDALLGRLRAFTKVHEARSSSLEMSEFKKRVKHRDTHEYVDEPNRVALKKAVSSIRV